MNHVLSLRPAVLAGLGLWRLLPSWQPVVTDLRNVSPAHDPAVPGSGAPVFLHSVLYLTLFHHHDLVSSSRSPGVTTRPTRCPIWPQPRLHGSARTSDGFSTKTRLRDACQVERQLKSRAEPVQRRSLVVSGSTPGMSQPPPSAAALAVTPSNQRRHEEVTHRAPSSWNHRRPTPSGSQSDPHTRQSCQHRGPRQSRRRLPRAGAG